MRKLLMPRFIPRMYLIILLILSGYDRSAAQLSITGPQCILPGTTYHYLLKGNRDGASAVKICITGGRLVSGAVCTPDSLRASQVFVIWNDTAATREIIVNSSAGNAGLSVVATANLMGGRFQEADRVQSYGKDSTVLFTFHCPDASGGSCSPHYYYKWQRSNNALNWTDIPGATGKDLLFSGNIVVDTFFRRVTVEANSTSIAYSDNAVLKIKF